MPHHSNYTLPKNAWITVGLLWTVGLLNYLDRVMLTTMHSSITDAIPMTDAQFGLLTSVFLWVYAAFSPFAGFISDRFSRSRVIICSLIMWSLVTYATSLATTYGQLLTTRALMGITEACYLPAALALITDYHRGDTRSKAEGIHISGVMIGSALGGFGGWIADLYRWDAAFSLFGCMGILLSVVMVLFLKDAKRETIGNMMHTDVETPHLPKIKLLIAIRSLFSSRSFNLAVLYWGLLGLAGWAIIGWLPVFMMETYNMTQGKAGLTTTGYLQSAMLIGVLVGGAWADRWYRSNERGRIYVPCIGLLVCVPAILYAINATSIHLALFGIVIYGFHRAFVDSNMMPILCMVTDHKYRATGFGVLNACSGIVGGLAIYAGGLLRDIDINLKYIFYAGSFGLLACSFIVLHIKTSNQTHSS